MCDEFTETAADTALTRKGLTRRDFAAMGAAGAAMLTWSGAAAAAAGLTERTVQVPTPDGTCDAFFVHPAKGAHPGVILWPDIAGLREAKQVMARRLAAEGYAVLVVNQYYRGAKAPVLASFAEWRTPEGQAKITPLRQALTAEAVTRDGKAYAAWLDGQAAVDKRRKIGTQGYCMGGPFTVRTAFAAPDRVGAAASFHGGGLVGDAADSPAKLLDKTKASYLFAIARNDDARAPGDKDALRAAADAAKRPAEIEVYPADHGWCVPDSPVYDAAQADRAWGRLLALYAKL
ncbi:dienelactone hydrolase family protein [Novosphingobium sp. PS1R-30]|uniref:Dienelactone hydrolase family protein n=1 Tax=Novosphingobium anseongense TaxID=3133436 RepID=A0ABU8RXL5_9SPHN|nr:MAG: dienelactone hydrolase family protein [Novosphingobium sp.]